MIKLRNEKQNNQIGKWKAKKLKNVNFNNLKIVEIM